MQLEQIVSSLTNKKIPAKVVEKMFDNLAAAAMEEENLKKQRREDIMERLTIIDRRRDKIKEQRRDVEASQNRILKAKQELADAIRAASEMESRQHTEIFLLDQQIGTLETRLRKSAPPQFYERVTEIDTELASIEKEARTFVPNEPGTGADWREFTCRELPGAIAKVTELRNERDYILNVKVLEEYGLSEQGEDHE